MGDSQRFRRIKAASGLLAVLSIPLFLLVYLRSQFDIVQLPIGQALPPMEFLTFEGEPIRSESLTGQKTALIFFTVECPKCKGQLEKMNQMQLRYGKLMRFLGVSLSERNKTREFLARQEYAFDVVHMDFERAKEVIGVAIVPTVLLVDEKQILRQRLVGEQPLMKTEKAVQEFLNSIALQQETRSEETTSGKSITP